MKYITWIGALAAAALLGLSATAQAATGFQAQESSNVTPRPHCLPVLSIAGRGGRARAPEEVSEELTPVMTRLGPSDLATVDTLITAGIANSRAEVLRWAVGRIREHPAYAQLQERVHEIDQLKAQF